MIKFCVEPSFVPASNLRRSQMFPDDIVYFKDDDGFWMAVTTNDKRIQRAVNRPNEDGTPSGSKPMPVGSTLVITITGER